MNNNFSLFDVSMYCNIQRVDLGRAILYVAISRSEIFDVRYNIQDILVVTYLGHVPHFVPQEVRCFNLPL